METSSDKTSQQNLKLILKYLSSKTFCKPKGTPYPVTMENIKEKCIESNLPNNEIFGLYNLLSELGGSGKSVAFDKKIHSQRQQGRQKDEEGDLIDIGDEGFTMRKCIKNQHYKCLEGTDNNVKKIGNVCIKAPSSPSSGGKTKKKRKKKHKKTRKKHKKRKMRKRKSKTRKVKN